MEEYKAKFIGFLLETDALKVGGDYSLKSKRISPWFVNIGNFDDGETSAALGQFYADAILSSREQFDLLYGIPDKGREIVVSVAIEMARKGRNVPRFSTRKVPKDHGEASAARTYGDARTVREFIAKMQHLSQTDRIKTWVIGREPENGQSIVQIDDVFTAGDAKYEALEMLKFLGDFKLPLLVIGVDRQEVGAGASGRSAIEEYEERTGTKVISVVNALDIYRYLKENVLIRTPTGEIRKEDIDRMENYLRVYGTEKARREIIKISRGIEQKII
jgi:orotate phosphoribosyltransferase